MRMYIPYILTILLIPFYMVVTGQISPGKLSNSHAHLEGVSNCTQCHDLGKKVPDSKCLACHEEIQSLINDSKGYHASSEVASLTCVDCHSDHHGRKFEMTRFDEDNFDHLLTGYELEQKHAIVDCRKCHTSENITNLELKKREGTFLGLDQNCISCHDDFHQGTLNNDCKSCHDIEAFRPAIHFEHAQTEFQLNGAHQDVSCIECHDKTIKNGKEFQQFSDVEFADCINCHSDPHNNLPGTCIQCHTESSFQNFIGARKFNHSRTSFELKGKHRNVNCFECHSNDERVSNIFRDHKGVKNEQCITCHEDIHEGKFGQQCIQCHSEEGWNQLSNLSSFDHNMTAFPLQGMHSEVDCKSCHLGESFIEPIDFQFCRNCHKDYHEGEFSENGNIQDCNSCHEVNSPFTYTTFTVDQHNLGEFPLEGAHLATPCFACHVSEDHWSFKKIGASCVDCHDDIHAGFITEKFYPYQDCTSCHSSERWSDINFDHNLTSWKLAGRHTEVSCRECHYQKNQNSSQIVSQSFVNLSSQCISCHENVHQNQFEIDGKTDCKRCHVSSSWTPENFDHNKTNFKLTGKHKEIDCRACHKEQETADGKKEILYKIERFECIDCHS